MTQEELTLRARILEAENAYHSIMTGAMATVIVDQNGERVEFNKVSSAKLYLYIQDLKSQLPDAAAPTFAKPIRWIF